MQGAASSTGSNEYKMRISMCITAGGQLESRFAPSTLWWRTYSCSPNRARAEITCKTRGADRHHRHPDLWVSRSTDAPKHHRLSCIGAWKAFCQISLWQKDKLTLKGSSSPTHSATDFKTKPLWRPHWRTCYVNSPVTRPEPQQRLNVRRAGWGSVAATRWTVVKTDSRTSGSPAVAASAMRCIKCSPRPS